MRQKLKYTIYDIPIADMDVDMNVDMDVDMNVDKDVDMDVDMDATAINTAHIYFIEGGISSGKTTIIESLRPEYDVFEEPLESWQTDYKLGDKNILELLYSDMKEHGFKFEMMSMVTRFKQLMLAIDTAAKTHRPVIIERSYMCCRKVFAQNLYNNGMLNELEWKIYTESHAMFSQLMKSLLSPHRVRYLYIRTSPAECFARKTNRARTEESEVQPEYFEQLHVLHDSWLLGVECKGVECSVGYSDDGCTDDSVGCRVEYSVSIDGDRTHAEVLADVKKYIV